MGYDFKYVNKVMKLQIKVIEDRKLKGDFNELQRSKSKFQLLINAFLVENDRPTHNKFIVI